MPAIRLKCKDCGRETTANVASATGKGLECAYCGEIFATGEVRNALERAKTGAPPPPAQGKKQDWNNLFKN